DAGDAARFLIADVRAIPGERIRDVEVEQWMIVVLGELGLDVLFDAVLERLTAFADDEKSFGIFFRQRLDGALTIFAKRVGCHRSSPCSSFCTVPFAATSSLRGRARALSQVANGISSVLKLFRGFAAACDVSFKRGDDDPPGSAVEIAINLAGVHQVVDLIM